MRFFSRKSGPPHEETREELKKRFGLSLKAILVLLGMLLLWPILFGIYQLGYSAYSAIDETRFPEVSPAVTAAIAEAGATPSDAAKGKVLAMAIHAQLERELASSFGWSVNDLVIMPTRWLDNRANRQRGVIFATRMLLRFFSTNMAKLGSADPEHPALKECRERRLVYGEDIWGFFRASSEGEYRASVKLINAYVTDLAAGKAQFNARTDDIYNALVFIDSEEFLGQALGQLVQSNDEVPYSELDDRIYYSQGAMLVVRDFLHAMMAMFPEITQRGGEENIKVAFHEMDRICDYDPLLVLRGDRDSLLADHRGKMARYLVSAMKRLEDVTKSLQR